MESCRAKIVSSSNHVTVDERRRRLRLIDYLRWVELQIYMTIHELSLTCTRRSGQGTNHYKTEETTQDSPDYRTNGKPWLTLKDRAKH
jgi:hypothetical protein